MKIKRFAEYVGPYSTTGFRYSEPTETFTLTSFVVIPNKEESEIIDTIEKIAGEYEVDVDINLKQVNMNYIAKHLKEWFSKQEPKANNPEENQPSKQKQTGNPLSPVLSSKKLLIEGIEELFGGKPTPDMIINSITRELEGELIYELKLKFKAYSHMEAISISNEIIQNSIDKIGEDDFMVIQYGFDLNSDLDSSNRRTKIGFRK